MSDLEDRLLGWWLSRRKTARWYAGISTTVLGPPAELRMSCYHADLEVKLQLLRGNRLINIIRAEAK